MLLIFAIITIVFLIYWWQKSHFNYWRSLGIPQVDADFPFGIVPKDRTLVETFRESYNKYKGTTRFVGIYNVFQPMLMVIDEDLVKQVLVKDFQYFQSRGMYHNEADDPMSAHLFNVDNPKWKALRSKLSPTFTSGKMKMMFPIIIGICEHFKKVIDDQITKGEKGIDMRELFARFTTDVIGNCAFGIECNCLAEPDSVFRQTGMKTFKKPRNGLFKQFLLMNWPNMARKLHIKHFRDDVSEFFMKVTTDNVEQRIKNGTKRNDFVDLLIALRNEQKSNSIEDSHMDGLSLNEIAAQCFVFFVAGFETSSSAASFTIYELSQNQVVQDKLRLHVREVLQWHNGELTYDSLKDMTYLEQCINEGMRKYPPLPLLTRKTTEVYQLPGTKITLPVGTSVGLPMYAIHHDSRNFPDPEVYDPDRFSPDESRKRHAFAHLPFGEGPRNCIGERFGMIQAKVGMAYLIGNYRFRLNPKTKPITFFKKSLVLAPNEGMYFDVEQVE